MEDPQTKYYLKVDLDKASLHGISAADVTRTLQVGLSGADTGMLHDPQSREVVRSKAPVTARPFRYSGS